MASARATALRLLARRDYSTAEIRQKLIDREFGDAEIDAAIARLSADRMLDDRRAAGAHVRISSRLKGRGRLRIQQELQGRGLARDVIREALAELPPDDERASVEDFLRRRRVPSQLTMAERRRVFQQLLRRGFTSDVIARALKDREGT